MLVVGSRVQSDSTILDFIAYLNSASHSLFHLLILLVVEIVVPHVAEIVEVGPWTKWVLGFVEFGWLSWRRVLQLVVILDVFLLSLVLVGTVLDLVPVLVADRLVRGKDVGKAASWRVCTNGVFCVGKVATELRIMLLRRCLRVRSISHMLDRLRC